MITERKRAPRRTSMSCSKCGKDVLLENIDILMMGGMPEKVWHNECLPILKHRDCLDTCSCKRSKRTASLPSVNTRKKKMVNNLHNGHHKPQTNGEEYDPAYLVEEYTGLKLPYTGKPEPVPQVTEISQNAEAKILLEKESTASVEGGGTTTQNDPKPRRIASQGHYCIKCGKPIVMTGRRGRPPIRCGNCKSGIT